MSNAISDADAPPPDGAAGTAGAGDGEMPSAATTTTQVRSLASPAACATVCTAAAAVAAALAAAAPALLAAASLAAAAPAGFAAAVSGDAAATTTFALLFFVALLHPPLLSPIVMFHCQFDLDQPRALPPLFPSQELLTHLQCAVLQAPRKAPAPTGRKDFVLEKFLVWEAMQAQVRQSHCSFLACMPDVAPLYAGPRFARCSTYSGDDAHAFCCHCRCNLHVDASQRNSTWAWHFTFRRHV